MGFRKKDKIYVLKFDGELEGLEVRMHGASAGQLIELDSMEYKTAEALTELFLLFGSKLISWNLETEDGTPITFDRDGDETPDEAKARVLKEQDIDFVFDILGAWKNAILGVSAPLGQRSTDGEQFPEESIPMETLS